MTILETLRRDGICVLPTLFDAASMMAHLDQCKKWNNHVKQSGEPPRPDSSSTCWSMEDVLCAPGWLEQAMEYMPLAREYLEHPPLLYSVNAFTTYPRTGPTQGDIQEFHRDTDDVRFVALFCYLTDVLIDDLIKGRYLVSNGPHEFVTSSHVDVDRVTRSNRELNDNEVIKIFGKAGTMFLADTRGLHRGVRPTTGPRTMAWARFGITDPPASYGWDKLSPIPSALLGDRYERFTQEQRDCIRLVVANG